MNVPPATEGLARGDNPQTHFHMKPTPHHKLTFLTILNTAALFAAESTQVLFDGKNLADWRPPTGTWQVGGSVALDPSRPEHFVVSPGQGVLLNSPNGSTVNLISVPEFGDIELH